MSHHCVISFGDTEADKGGYGIGSDGSSERCRACGDSVLSDDGVESGAGGGSVLHGADAAVGLDQAVAALHHVAAAALLLLLGVAGQGVADAVAEAVLRVGVVVGVDGFGSGQAQAAQAAAAGKPAAAAGRPAAASLAAAAAAAALAAGDSAAAAAGARAPA
ncbi:homeobox protein Hox-A13-like [Schistocerca nitens]|uniref:homeobox protein Hox-A13-like n=1 Tax=Schistocerca nitens TaxID=7011 RepID=UPI0021177A2B|nr:homeobox protein Hox-A13-like [Schistocerca nitens]